VLVRHNTTLLEQAVDLAVKRSAIPTLQAEAAAQEKTARATAFRRMATGGAIAVAAVGIGLGIKLGLWDKNLPEPVTLPKIEQPSARTVPTDDPEPIPIPTPKPAQETPKADLPTKPDVVTVDFNKFATKNVEFQGSTWELITGHHMVLFSPECERRGCERIIGGSFCPDVATSRTRRSCSDASISGSK
jgi:hypothetical protein